MSTARALSQPWLATTSLGTKIGINTTTPAYQLDVNGDINVAGNIRSKGKPYRPYPRLSKSAADAAASSWRFRTPPNNTWISVCWAPELSMFCAVSYTAAGNGVMTSSDGINWTTHVSAADIAWRSVCWAPELSMFCAVAASGTGNRVMTSPDGITWTTRASAADNAWLAVCWAPELSMFCAVADTGRGNRVMTSPDGLTWTARASAADNAWQAVCWAPELSMFCAVANTRVMTSADGITWVTRVVPTGNWLSVCWSPELSMFCAVADSGLGGRAMTSADGIAWTRRASADSYWSYVCWAPELSMFCAVSLQADKVMTSSDGITWVVPYVPSNTALWRAVCWSPELSMLCAVANTGELMTCGPPAWRPTPGYTNLYLDALGTGTVYSSAGALTNAAPSDKDLKRDIVPLTDCLGVMRRLRPVSFKWKDVTRFGDRQEYGLIAQEVQEVLPDLVRNDPNTQVLGYDPVSLLPFTIQAIKELYARRTKLITYANDVEARIKACAVP